MVLELDSNKYEAKVCYISGRPDGKNILDKYGLSIYLNIDNLNKHRIKVLGILKKIIKTFKPDILHCHRHSMTVLGVMAKLGEHIKLVSHVHGLNRTRSLKRRIINFAILKFVEKIIAVSDSVKQDIFSSNFFLEESKIITIRNCVDLNIIDSIQITKTEEKRKIGLTDNHIVFGNVGRLVKTKGQFFLIEAFVKVLHKLHNARLVIVGSGELYKDLKKQVEDLGIKEYVLFTGFREDVLEIIRSFDIFVLPSLAEGLSIALLEAMASRLPVIASNVGGIPEVFGDSQCGILVPPKDIESLRDAMLKMATLSEGERKKLGDNGRARIEKEFTIEKMIMNLTNLYDSILLKSNNH
ncbi:MAG: glycosyltransferase [Candidatus Micrarchaeia archaeon]